MLAGRIEADGVSDIFGSSSLDLAKENFIRSPKLIKRIKAEVTKFSLIKETMASIQQFIDSQKDKQLALNQFIEAVYTRTIRKKGALYVYDKEIEEDAWEPFLNLTKTTEFVDYELFKSFTNLGPKQHDQLMRTSALRSSELINQEGAAGLIWALEEMAASYQKEKEALDYDYKDLGNGEELYEFYKEMMIKVSNMLRQLKS